MHLEEMPYCLPYLTTITNIHHQQKKRSSACLTIELLSLLLRHVCISKILLKFLTCWDLAFSDFFWDSSKENWMGHPYLSRFRDNLYCMVVAMWICAVYFDTEYFVYKFRPTLFFIRHAQVKMSLRLVKKKTKETVWPLSLSPWRSLPHALTCAQVLSQVACITWQYFSVP